MDLTGDTYGKLTVRERAEDIDGSPAWRCRCECGKETVVRPHDLKSGVTQSCGCVRKARKRPSQTEGDGDRA